jgi:hypothetical protein
MNIRLNTIVMTSAVLLLGLAWSGNVIAQEPASTMPKPATDRASCSEIDWHRDMLRDYPWVADACHEAVVVDGQKWARFEAEFKELNRDGTITSEFKNQRGRSLGNVSLQPGPNQRVMLDGRPTAFSDLRRGQVLNFYAPEGEFSFTTEPGAPASEQLQITQRQDQLSAEERRLAEQRREEQARADRQLAQADRTTTQRRDTLPATAGPLPILALGGLLSLLGGMTLTMRRRFTRK